jgi:copper chaperone CopZ
MQTTVPLQNIHCEGCVRNVQNALGLIEGIEDVQVDRASLLATVSFQPPATEDAIRAQLDLGGYLASPNSA